MVMRRAIDLNGEPGRWTVEIENVRSNRVLSPKTELI
jgi:hypothetical protein